MGTGCSDLGYEIPVVTTMPGAGGVLHESDEQEKREKLGLSDDARSLYTVQCTAAQQEPSCSSQIVCCYDYLSTIYLIFDSCVTARLKQNSQII